MSKSNSLDDALRSFSPMDSTEAFRRLQALVQSHPELEAVDDDSSCPTETLKWLGQLAAVVSAMKRISDELSLRSAVDRLIRTRGGSGSGDIRAILYRTLAAAELLAPASEQGAFIAAGNELDAYTAISKVLSGAADKLFVVDPYMDGKALTDFMPSVQERVSISILADAAFVKPTLAPAAQKWQSQFGYDRPIEVRLAIARTLHDRIIIVDNQEVWILTQSLKDFASRAHGSVVKTDNASARLKIEAYSKIWDDSTNI